MRVINFAQGEFLIVGAMTAISLAEVAPLPVAILGAVLITTTLGAVVALVFCYIVDGNFGLLNDLLVRIGLIDNYFSFLSDPTASFWVIVSAMVWYGTPLMALILLAWMQHASSSAMAS